MPPRADEVRAMPEPTLLLLYYRGRPARQARSDLLSLANGSISNVAKRLQIDIFSMRNVRDLAKSSRSLHAILMESQAKPLDVTADVRGKVLVIDDEEALRR